MSNSAKNVFWDSAALGRCKSLGLFTHGCVLSVFAAHMMTACAPSGANQGGGQAQAISSHSSGHGGLDSAEIRLLEQNDYAAECAQVESENGVNSRAAIVVSVKEGSPHQKGTLVAFTLEENASSVKFFTEVTDTGRQNANNILGPREFYVTTYPGSSDTLVIERATRQALECSLLEMRLNTRDFAFVPPNRGIPGRREGGGTR